ncbi:hypothetical protein RJT34_19556 [Clitoria ternatea]|uniref:Pentatricopeptide repeat-containing protein n=1 Tax=Clitoria ternatea TaxID=43366 RepID=A0AAN9IRN0_CLITE
MALEQGKQLHAHVRSIGIDLEARIHNALASMYSKCQSLQEASKIFNRNKMNDIISWTIMIIGYAEHSYSQEAINLFKKISSVGLIAGRLGEAEHMIQSVTFHTDDVVWFTLLSM